MTSINLQRKRANIERVRNSFPCHYRAGFTKNKNQPRCIKRSVIRRWHNR